MFPSFKIAPDQLTVSSCDRVLRDLAAFIERHREESGAVVNLGEVSFLDPYGMGMLCLIGRYLKGRFAEVIYELPDVGGVRSYLGRMKFMRALEGHVIIHRRNWSAEYAEGMVNEALLEITRIERRGDVEAVLKAINDRVSAILTEELRYTVREITAFKHVIAELCHNILDHSADWGYVSAQRYTDHRRGKKFAVIGVVDLGIGIRQSLSARFDVSRWTHATAIIHALRKEVSRESRRGLGLYVVQQICSDYDGSLHIRSGDARVYIRRMNTYAYPSTPFPGTQVSIALYEKNG